MVEIARRHGLPERVRLFPTGSAIVFAAGDGHVVKLHEPWHRDLYENEVACLALVRDRLSVPSSEVVATGELEGWAYLIMTRLPGEPLSEVRDRVSHPELVAITEQTAALARSLHAVAVPATFRRESWNDFSRRQRARCGQHHRERGLPAPLVDSLDAQFEGIDLETDAPVFLHTELTDTNLMVSRADGRWQLSGVFDFEPSMLGHPLYDLPAIAIFVARGDPVASRAGMAAFGVEGSGELLRRQLMACTLLHRYSHLAFFLGQVGVRDYPPEWGAVARALFGF